MGRPAALTGGARLPFLKQIISMLFISIKRQTNDHTFLLEILISKRGAVQIQYFQLTTFAMPK